MQQCNPEIQDFLMRAAAGVVVDVVGREVGAQWQCQHSFGGNDNNLNFNLRSYTPVHLGWPDGWPKCPTTYTHAQRNA